MIAAAQKIGDRSHTRVPLEIEVTMASENNFWAGLTDNLSEGGVFVATHVPPACGTEVEMTLILPRGRTFAVRGVVRWIRSYEASCEGMPPGCGIQWTTLPDGAYEAITSIVNRRGTLLYDDLE